MLLVVAYDVETTNPTGAKRLRSVAKLCQKYGVRVQNSVFEIETSAAQLVELKGGLQSIIDQEQDSIRIYRLGNSWQNKIEVLGKKPIIQSGAEIILSCQPQQTIKIPKGWRKKLPRFLEYKMADWQLSFGCWSFSCIFRAFCCKNVKCF